jgi:ADP-ribose pyrophosphatase YjhB (NUDIX family)
MSEDIPTADAIQDLPWAVAVLIWRGPRVLLIRRAPGVPLPGFWTPVTGRVEPGEGLLEACHREVKEEIGLEIEVIGAFHEGLTNNQRFRLVYHEARHASGELTLAPDEVSEALWLDPAEALARTPMLPTTRAILATHFERRP